jgi:predicted TIM-barrel fold metal-dependent hydrolase
MKTLRDASLITFLGFVLEHMLTPLTRQARSYLQPLLRLSRLHSHVKSEQASQAGAQSILRSMPSGAWDCHMHVTSPEYPLAANAAYKPALHNLQHAMSFEKTVGISNIVLVQPSIYGNDNSCLLDALKAIGPHHGRGVVGIDPDTIRPEDLEEWHKLGVRGVRLNLKSTNVQFTEASLRDTLKRYEKAIKPLNWVLELFIGMEHIPILDRIAEDLNVRLCIAHFGAPKLPAIEKREEILDPYDLAGFRSLINLLARGNTWLKFSAAYRFDDDAEMRGIEAIAGELLKKAGDRIVFASDWPHTRFDGLDVRPFVERCLEWTSNAGLTEQVFTLNARELWDVRE